MLDGGDTHHVGLRTAFYPFGFARCAFQTRARVFLYSGNIQFPELSVKTVIYSLVPIENLMCVRVLRTRNRIVRPSRQCIRSLFGG